MLPLSAFFPALSLLSESHTDNQTEVLNVFVSPLQGKHPSSGCSISSTAPPPDLNPHTLTSSRGRSLFTSCHFAKEHGPPLGWSTQPWSWLLTGPQRSMISVPVGWSHDRLTPLNDSTQINRGVLPASQEGFYTSISYWPQLLA